MNRVKHKTVLNVLEQRAERFWVGKDSWQSLDEMLYEDALDETGMVDTKPLSETDGEGAYQSFEMLEELEVREIVEELLEVYGLAPGKKADGIVRLIYENVNGLNPWMTNNGKLDEIRCD